MNGDDGHKLSIPEFAAKIKAKYPAYKDLNDTTLVEKVIEKYPVYKDKVEDLAAATSKKKEPEVEPKPTEQAQPKPQEQQSNSLPPQEKPRTATAATQKFDFDSPSILPKGLSKHDLNVTITKQNEATEAINKDAVQKVTDMTPQQMNDPLGYLYGSYSLNQTPHEKAVTVRAANMVKADLAHDGYDAKKVLEKTHFGDKGTDNYTSQHLRTMADQYDKDVAFLRGIKVEGDYDKNDYKKGVYADEIQAAAIRWRASNDKEFRHEVGEVAGLDNKLNVKLDDPDLAHRINSNKAGETMNMFLNNKNVVAYLTKEHPELAPAFEYAAKNNLDRNKEYGIKTVATEVSMAREKSGYNMAEPIFNYHGKNSEEYNNLLAQQMFAKDPQKMNIWNNYIRDHQRDYMDEPSFFEGAAEDIQKVYEGVGHTFTRPFESASDAQVDKWEEEARTVSADPKGTMALIRNGGKATGFVMALAAGGEALEATGMSPQMAQRVMTVSTFFGDELDKSLDKYKNPLLAWTDASLNTTLYAALSDIFPASKAKQAFQEVRADVSKSIENLTNGAIDKEVLRREMNASIVKAVDWGSRALKQNVKASLEMTAIGGVNQGFDKVFGLSDEQYNKYHPSNELINTFTSMFMNNSLVSGFAAGGEMRRENKLFENSVYSAVSNPIRTMMSIDDIASKHPDANTKEMLANLKFAMDVKQALDKQKIPIDKQKKYIAAALRGKVIQEAAEKTPDEALKKLQQADVNFFNKMKDEILTGEEHSAEVESQLHPDKEKEGKLVKSVNGIDIHSLGEGEAATHILYKPDGKEYARTTDLSQAEELAKGYTGKEATPIVQAAVVEVGGKIYEGKNHAEALLKAKADGQDISEIDRQGAGKFRLSDGSIIDRKEAMDRFGRDHAEQLIEQDEASKQANEDYKAITEPKEEAPKEDVNKLFDEPLDTSQKYSSKVEVEGLDGSKKPMSGTTARKMLKKRYEALESILNCITA